MLIDGVRFGQLVAKIYVSGRLVSGGEHVVLVCLEHRRHGGRNRWRRVGRPFPLETRAHHHVHHRCSGFDFVGL